MKKSPSFFDRLSPATQRGSKLVVFFSHNFALILNSSKGRDKILGSIQYIAELYKECMMDFLASKRIREWPNQVLNAKMLYSSLQSGRKIFRLLRWMQEINGVMRQLSKPLNKLVILKTLKHLASCIYYILDNLVWLSSIGFISKSFSGTTQWQEAKDIVSLIKYFFLFIIGIMASSKKIGKERKVTQYLKTKTEFKINGDSGGFKVILKLLKYRTQKRLQILDMFRIICRLFIVLRSIEVKGTETISKVFCSVCGLASNFISIFKILAMKAGNDLGASIK